MRGPLRRPGDAGYDTVRLTENPRYDDNHPLAVLTVASTNDVATAIAWARDHDVPVALRSGGHSYPGWSAGGAPGTGVPRALVIDCRALDSVSVHADGTAAVGALMTVQYTGTYSGDRSAAASSYVRGFRTAMTPYWGNHAYVNYADPAVLDDQVAYFGANATRLASVKEHYDPDNFFDQPQGY